MKLFFNFLLRIFSASEGVNKYKETNDIALALKVAANSGFQGYFLTHD